MSMSTADHLRGEHRADAAPGHGVPAGRAGHRLDRARSPHAAHSSVRRTPARVHVSLGHRAPRLRRPHDDCCERDGTQRIGRKQRAGGGADCAARRQRGLQRPLRIV